MEMTAITITHHPHPILPAAGRSLHVHAYAAGQCVREVLLSHGFDAHQEIVISLNDRLLLVEEWGSLSPAPGDLLNVQVAVSGGGGGGSNPLKIIATIAIAIIAPEIAAFMFEDMVLAGAMSSMAFTAATAVIGFAGNMLVNALFTPSANSLKTVSQTGEAASPTYSLAGGSNASRPYQPLPIVMGVHRIFPDYGSKPFTQYSGEDQYLYMIFNFGPSSLGLSDYRIGNTGLEDFKDVTLYWPDAAGVLTAFPGNVDTTAGGEIKRGEDWVLRTTSVDTITLAVDVEGMVYYAGDNGLVECAATVEAWYAPAGTAAWVPMGTAGVKIYETHYWSMGNWETREVYVTYGSGDSESGGYVAETYWAQREAGSALRADHVDGGTVVIASTRANGYTGGTFTWRWRPYSEILSNGDGSALLETAPAQPYSVVTLPTLEIAHGASQKPQRRTLYAAVASGQYDVRVRLNSARWGGGELSYTNNRQGIQYTFGQLRSYQQDAGVYLGQTRLGMSIKASGQLNGVVQQLSALATAYCATWSAGAWQWGSTSNPAWWFLDFARGRYNSSNKLLYGVGLPDAQIDIDGIKAWAVFCDAQGMSFNAVIDQRQSCADVLTMIARCGLASTSWASGKLGVVWDKPNASPVMAFGMGNIARGSFHVEYLTESMADEIVVGFVDASRDWQQQQVRVLVPGVTAPDRPANVELMGCTNATMAGKFANVLAAQQYYRRRTITFETDFEGFICQRGDVVLLSHDLTQWGYSGRLIGVAGNVVTLSRPVPRAGTADYLMLRQPDGTLTTYTVNPASGDSDTLTLATPPTLQAGEDEINHLWFFSPLPTPGKLVKIISVQPVSMSRVRLVATDEDPAFYAAWNGTWSQPARNDLLKNLTPQITAISISETLAILGAGNVGSLVTVAISADHPVDNIALRWRVAGGPWTALEYPGGTVTLETESTGLLEIEARPFFGALIGRQFATSATLYGKTLPPGDVAWFIIEGNLLRWSAVPDVDLAGYQIRYVSGGTADWAVGSPLHDGLLPVNPQQWSATWLPRNTATLMIRGVDTSGNVSNTSATITLNLGDPIIENVVETIDLRALGFPGVHAGSSIVAGDLDATLSAVIWNPNAAVNMWMADPADPMYGLTYYQALTYRTAITVTAALDQSQLTLATSLFGEGVTLEYRRPGGDSAFMWGSSSGVMWSGDSAAPMRANAPGYTPWPGAITASLGVMDIRIKAAFSRTQGRIDALVASFDVPDIFEHINDVAISAAGTRLTLTKQYTQIKGVHLTVQDDGGSAVTARVMDKSITGPLTQCFNTADAPAAGLIDAYIQGY